MKAEMKHRQLLAAAAAVFLALPGVASSQAYPNQPITITVTFPPGGSADVTTRIIGERLSAKLGQPVVIENRPGAGGEVGTMLFVRAEPDGHRLLSTSSGSVALVGTLRTIGYNAETDIVPIAMLVKVPTGIAVNASLPIHSIADLVKYSKERPGGIAYSNAGVGSFMHLAGEIFRVKSGANLVSVPYRGTAPAALAVKAGETQMTVADLTSLQPLVADGSIRILAMVDSVRSSVAPAIPTVSELGLPGFGLDAWMGMFAPRGTSPEIVTKLNSVINEALMQPEVRKRILAAGLDPWVISPQDMAAFVKEEIARWKVLVSEANVKM